MKNYKRVNIEAFEEKGNRGMGIAIDTVEALNKLNENKQKIATLYQKWNKLKSTKTGSYIFYLEYKNLIPPKSKRIVFNSDFYNGKTEVINMTDVRQKGIFTKYKNNHLLVNLYYEINKQEYMNFKKFLETLLAKEEITKKDRNLIDNFKKLIDIDNVDNPKPPALISQSKLVQLLPIDWAITELIKLDILNQESYFEDLNTAFLSPNKYAKLFNNYPELIITCSDKEDLFGFETTSEMNIFAIDFKPKWNKTKIGVIDTGVSLDNEILQAGVVFSKDLRQFKKFQNLDHGTIVSSLIIANDELNPGQKDGFGNFKVKHFEVLEPSSEQTKPSANFEHLKNNLEKIIKENPDVKVWNLSFGSLKQPYDLKISYWGVLLDKISYKYDVIFVCPSGNDRNKTKNLLHSLNFPADALNALSVGSVMREKKQITYAPYSSIGQILQYEKPEVSYFGGPYNNDLSPLWAIDANGFCSLKGGTSFAAPRVARMLAHYIEEGYSPFEAKAKIINMTERESRTRKSSSFGFINPKDGDIELRLTISLKNNKPFYLPLDLVGGTNEVVISSAMVVKPNSKLGEEYNMHNVDVSLIWYDPTEKNPEHSNRAKTLTKEHVSNEYASEKSLRMDGGKYFSSSKKTFILNNKKNFNPEPESYKLALRVKKLNLFDTKEEQKAKASIAISIFGDFNASEFEKRNEAIIMTDIEQEIAT